MDLLTAPASRQKRRTPRRQYVRPAEGPQNLSQFFAQQRQRMTQVFWIDSQQKNIIQTREEMQIQLAPFSFMDNRGRPIEGKVKLEIIELNKKSDIVLANRPTTSGNQLLETGGAFLFRPSFYGQDVQLRRSARASLPISRQVRTPNYMSIFTGQSRGRAFDWRPDTGVQGGLEINSLKDTFEVEIQQPGWINCDHFYRMLNQQHYDIEVQTNIPQKEQEVFLIYRAINTVAKMKRREDGFFYFPNPIPMPSIIYGLGGDDGQFHQGFYVSDLDPNRMDRETNEAKPSRLQLDMNPVSSSKVKTNLDGIIRSYDQWATEKTLRRDSAMRRQFRRMWRNRK